jgi:hypothetical protein
LIPGECFEAVARFYSLPQFRRKRFAIPPQKAGFAMARQCSSKLQQQKGSSQI